MRHLPIVVFTIYLTANIVNSGRSQDSWDHQQSRAPFANAVGRFFGFGYSAGYHSQAESRFGWHRYVPDQNKVPEPYRGPMANTAGYIHPGNAPQTYGAAYGMPMNSGTMQGMSMQPGMMQGMPMQPGMQMATHAGTCHQASRTAAELAQAVPQARRQNASFIE